MNPLAVELGRRIRELRRRHFGRGGAAAFSDALGITAADLERAERGVLPDGDLLVRMCELTGEDLQWLLTGKPSRGAVVITSARPRHQELLARVARILDQDPALAGQIEAFLDLLLAAQQLGPQSAREALPEPAAPRWIPVFEDHAPPELGGPDGGPQHWLTPASEGLIELARSRAELLEPADDLAATPHSTVAWLQARTREGAACEFVDAGAALQMVPNLLAIRIHDQSMQPMIESGDAVIVALGAAPELARPALLRIEGEPAARCRIWLGERDGLVQLGRAADGATEAVPSGAVRWALEVLFRVRRAA